MRRNKLIKVLRAVTQEESRVVMSMSLEDEITREQLAEKIFKQPHLTTQIRDSRSKEKYGTAA